jgi:hypothetical protein
MRRVARQHIHDDEGLLARRRVRNESRAERHGNHQSRAATVLRASRVAFKPSVMLIPIS